MVTLNGTDPLSESLLAGISDQIAGFLGRQRTVLAGLYPELSELTALAETFTAGGKRIRPAFCCWGYLAARGGSVVPHQLLQAAASLDLLHVSALIHDDLMDASATRRGLAAAHVQLARHHAQTGRRGSSERFGQAGAILLGDLLLAWSVEMFTTCGLPPEAMDAAAPFLSAIRAEVTGGQYLDVSAQTRPAMDARTDAEAVTAQVRRVVEFKTARYTVIRPLQAGAALGGGSSDLVAMLARYGSPLGQAFQYRDDVLGVFGDEEVTGKPAGDDLREAKLTMLIAKAMAGTSAAGAARLDSLLGKELNTQELTEAREIIVDSGALEATESEIEKLSAASLKALDPVAIGQPALAGLQRLAVLATRRTF